MKLHTVAFILILVGGVNLGLRGLGTFFGQYWDILNRVLGPWNLVEAAVYLLIGAAAVYEIVTHKQNCKDCGSGASA